MTGSMQLPVLFYVAVIQGNTLAFYFILLCFLFCLYLGIVSFVIVIGYSSYLMHLIYVVTITIVFLFSIVVHLAFCYALYSKHTLPPVVCRRAHVLFTVFVFVCVGGVQHIPRCAFVLFVLALCLVYPMLPVALDCPFLISPSVFSNVYLYEDSN